VPADLCIKLWIGLLAPNPHLIPSDIWPLNGICFGLSSHLNLAALMQYRAKFGSLYKDFPELVLLSFLSTSGLK